MEMVEIGRNMVDFNPTTSTITLKVNSLNAPTKRQRVSDWIKEQDLACTCKKPTSNIETQTN